MSTTPLTLDALRRYAVARSLFTPTSLPVRPGVKSQYWSFSRSP